MAQSLECWIEYWTENSFAPLNDNMKLVDADVLTNDGV